jgi:hypothetical protein
MRTILFVFIIPLGIVFSSCHKHKQLYVASKDSLMMKMNDFASFTLTTDLTKLSDREKKMIPILIEAAKIMDDIFWIEAYGDKDTLMDMIRGDEGKKLVEINYGPWDRINNDLPLFEGMGNKFAGANFYPHGMSIGEFEKLDDTSKTGLYSLIRRDEKGALTVVPYYKAFHDQVQKVSSLLMKASQLADDRGFKRYLELRARAFLNDDYRASDFAWMEMTNNTLDIVIGPIETYEDQLFGYKAAHEAFLLVKDLEWSNRLKRYAAFLPDLQKNLPVEALYKTEMPASSSDLAAYDVIFYAGDCNAGSKTIAINLPNDEQVQLTMGSRRLQLKNAMKAKFDKILEPIAAEMLPADQLKQVNFDAFFVNTMFHEIAHGLGLNNTINNKGTIREALKEQYTTLEENKADILGLYLQNSLQEMGVEDFNMTQAYTTFLSNIFRSIRFGATSAHGKANLISYYYLKERNAFTIDSNGKYSMNPVQMKDAIRSLSALILTIQGDGDYRKATELINKYCVMDQKLKSDVKMIQRKDIPVDITFNQGLSVLGL